MRRWRLSRRLVLGSWLASITSSVWAGFLYPKVRGGRAASAPPNQPSIIGITIAGSSSAVPFPANTGNANIGQIVITTLDNSTANFTLSGNSEGFHPTSGQSGQRLQAPAEGLAAGNYTDVTITATGSYSNSGQVSINPTLTASSGVLTVAQNVTRPTGTMWLGGTAPNGSGPNNEYSDAAITAFVTGGPGNTTDFLAWAKPSDRDSTHHNPVYLNGSPTTPPARGLVNATVTVPAVRGLFFSDGQNAWNPTLELPTALGGRGTPVTSWQLRLYNGPTGAVVGRVAITIDILKRSGFTNYYFGHVKDFLIGGQYPCWFIVRPLNGVLPNGGGSHCNVVSGTIQIATGFGAGQWPNAPGTLTMQYTLNDQPIGAPLTDTAGGVGSGFGPNICTLTFDTTTVADGTYALGGQVVDFVPGAGADDAAVTTPYYWRCSQQIVIIHNSNATTIAELYSGANGPFSVPLVDDRVHSVKADFVKHPGTNALPMHSISVPIPTPQSGVIPPVCSSASPFYNANTHGGALLGTPAGNFYYESLVGAIPREYQSQQRFLTTRIGGIFSYPTYPEAGQNQVGDLPVMQSLQPYDGARCDCQASPIVSAIEGIDPNNADPNRRSFWLSSEEGGRIARLDYNGAATTLCGHRGNRSILPYPTYENDTSFTQNELISRMEFVGTIGSPSFANLMGQNDLCYDPTDASGNTIYIANTLNQCIVKVTNLLSGNRTLVRYAGQDFSLGGTANPGNSFAGDYQDGVRTEFIQGSMVATFTGTINNRVLTISGPYNGSTNLKGCPISWSGAQNTTTGNMIITNISGVEAESQWNTNVVGNVGPVAMTASTQVALFNQPYSCQIADGSTTGPDPVGTMYVCDFQNCALRRIDATTGMVTTLFGNQDNAAFISGGNQKVGWVGAMGTAAGPTQFFVTSLSWAGGVLTVVASVPVQADSRHGFSVTHGIGPYWSIGFSGTGANFDSSNPNDNGAQTFVVLTVSDSQHFTLNMPNNPGTIPSQTGSGYAFAYFQDVFLPPGPNALPWNHGTSSEAHFVWMQRIVWSSQNPAGSTTNTRHLAAGGPWHEGCVDVDLQAQTVRLIGYNSGAVPYARGGNAGQDAVGQTSASWFQIDCDNRSLVPSGSVNDPGAGCIGPVDDIIISHSSSSLINILWRLSWDGTRSQPWSKQDLGFGSAQPLNWNTNAGTGHYPWTTAISRSQGRFLGSGLSDIGVTSLRIKNPAYDIDGDAGGTNYNIMAATRGYAIYTHGAAVDWVWTNQPPIWPFGMRPCMWSLHGPTGFQLLFGLSATTINGSGVSNSNTESIDALVTQFPTDAALGAFIQAGFGGSVPRPEITGDDLKDLIYWIRRSSQHGSFTLPTPLRAPYETNVTAPVISAASATRQSTTSVLVTWTTTDSSGLAVGSGGGTYGCVVAGYDSGHGTQFPYHITAPEAYGGANINNSYRSSHSVTLTGLKSAAGAGVTTYIRIIAKDMAGNNAISAEQTVT
jgi:hypothetical protein